VAQDVSAVNTAVRVLLNDPGAYLYTDGYLQPFVSFATAYKPANNVEQTATLVCSLIAAVVGNMELAKFYAGLT
jgi:uncharacterized membrane protein